MLFTLLFSSSLLALLNLALVPFIQALNSASHTNLSPSSSYGGNNTQNIVTWDQFSVMVRGERVLFLSGEFHPFRLPSPGLWLDVFEKIKALGFSGVSFYVNWALLEPSSGDFQAEGVFSLQEFFDAASQAGIYLLARPGPYINSEVSGGGYPGWVSRIKGPIRTNATDWLDATRNYIQRIGSIINRAQITKGGPIILFQPENEYSLCAEAVENGTVENIGGLSKCLNKYYMADVEAMWREAGIVVPFILNDALPIGNFAPGSGLASVDIYGYDNYPLGWGTSCASPSNWNRSNTVFPTTITNYTIHMGLSPSSPFSIVEFQGGSAEPWGGGGVAACASLLNHEFERVIYKVVYGFRTTVLNLYMMFGGTNWGNMGHPLGYTSYDVGAAIAENREVSREKYSELKLQANFLQASPAYLKMIPQESEFGIYTNTTELVTTPLISNGEGGAFYIVRQSDWTSEHTVKYVLQLSFAGQALTIPQLGGALSLVGRDSKIHVLDYDVGGIRLVYSTAEIFTWKRSSDKMVLILYGGIGETHEFCVDGNLGSTPTMEGDGVRYRLHGSLSTVQWDVEPKRRVVHFGNNLEVYLLSRNDAYSYWVLGLPMPKPINNFVSASRINASDASVVVKAGYLMRRATISDNCLYLSGDVNATTVIEVISSPLGCGSELYFNDKPVENIQCIEGRLTGTIPFQKPEVILPDLSALKWRYVDSLPEIQDNYDDSLWVTANIRDTYNTRALTTPVSLYASDYGFHAGSIIYRGHFKAAGNDSTLFLSVSGGNAFSHAVWLNSTFLGSWRGDPDFLIYNQTFDLPPILHRGDNCVITVLMDHMGLTESFLIGVEGIKEPRGILNYALSGGSSHRPKSDVTWKLTGNLGGEHPYDRSRGPRNEGGLFAERQGFHLPNAPLEDAEIRSPITDGLSGVGVGFFATKFTLDIPHGYDVPLSLRLSEPHSLTNGTSSPTYRVQLFVNGWQYGKYVNTIGPQFSFPVPEGILNYQGENYLALTLWSLEPSGAKLGTLSLEIDTVVQSGYNKPYLVQGEVYTRRADAY
ncbi:glycoside hydrolase superfamily [Xylaria sp. FL1042]|nr:glycoside hydrolase superfamily [Xylaria sp. FL1042]